MSNLPLKITGPEYLKTLAKIAGLEGTDALNRRGFRNLVKEAGIKTDKFLSRKNPHSFVTKRETLNDIDRLRKTLWGKSSVQRREYGTPGNYKDKTRTKEEILRRTVIAKKTLLETEARERGKERAEQIKERPEDKSGQVNSDRQQRLAGRLADARAGLPSRTMLPRTAEEAGRDAKVRINKIKEQNERDPNIKRSALQDISVHSAISDMPGQSSYSGQENEPPRPDSTGNQRRESGDNPSGGNQPSSKETDLNLPLQ